MKQISVFLVTLAMFALNYWAGYRHGRLRPALFYAEQQGVTLFVGWDKGNGCVGAWRTDTNGGIAWQRLEHFKR